MSRRRIDSAVIVALILVIPIVAWFLAKNYVAEPRIVAPFLFVSPAIALTVAGMFIGGLRNFKKLKIEHRQEPPDSEMEALAARFAGEAGLKGYELRVVTTEAGGRSEAVAGADLVIWIYSGPWEQLDATARQFGMAMGIAQIATRRHRRPFVVGAFSLLALLGCALGMINLWFIIPAQAAFASAWFARMFRSMREDALKSDALALGWTRDLEAAIEYISATAREHAGPFCDRKTRLANLRESAKRLGLAS